MPSSSALSFDIIDIRSHAIQVQSIPAFESYFLIFDVTIFAPLKWTTGKG